MANYYTLSSFLVPCNPAQAMIAVAAVRAVDGQFSRGAMRALSCSSTDSLNAMERIIRHIVTHHPDYDRAAPELPLDFYFRLDAVDNGLHVHHHESINTDHAAIFAQAVLIAFSIDVLVVFGASFVCSSARVDGFGGEYVAVSKDAIRYSTAVDFIDAVNHAHHKKERYFVCSLIEINGEYEYESRFLMKCAANESEEDRLRHVFANFRGHGSLENDDFVWFPDGLAAKEPSYHEIDPVEYHVLKKHLSVL